MRKPLCASPHQLCCHTPIYGLLLLFSLFLSLILSLAPSLPGSNKGLTVRAWRSWLLDGKGERHSWAGQASSLAKWWVVCSETRVGGVLLFNTVFFLSLQATWFGEEKPQGLLIKCRVWVRRRGVDNELVEILSKWCVFVYMSSSDSPRGVHTCCVFSSIWASVAKVARAKQWNM